MNYRYLIVILCILFHGCGMNDLMDKTKKMQDIAFQNCECDDVKLISYSTENFRTAAYIEIIGAKLERKNKIANKINEAFINKIEDYCDIDKLELDFINRGNHEIVTIRYCKIDN